MIYTGTVIAESLHDESVFHFVENIKREHAQLVDALAGQEKNVTIVTFTVQDELVGAVVDELSRLIKPSHWYADIKYEFDNYVIFPGKIFHFTPKEIDKRQKAYDYAKTLGIPEKQIDF